MIDLHVAMPIVNRRRILRRNFHQRWLIQRILRLLIIKFQIIFRCAINVVVIITIAVCVAFLTLSLLVGLVVEIEELLPDLRLFLVKDGLQVLVCMWRNRLIAADFVSLLLVKVKVQIVMRISLIDR